MISNNGKTVTMQASRPPKLCTILLYHPNSQKAQRLQELLAPLKSLVANILSCLTPLELGQNIQSPATLVVLPLHEDSLSVCQKIGFSTSLIVWDETTNSSLAMQARLLKAGVQTIIRGDAGTLRESVQQQIHKMFSAPLRQETLLSIGARNNLVGHSSAWLEVLERVYAASAQPEAAVLLYGKSGTGKELVAQAIHREGHRDKFMGINCGAMHGELVRSELFGHKKGSFTDAHADHKGFFEVARGGTVFLDEIHALDVRTQGLLLRAIQEREFFPVGSTQKIQIYDVRLIASTNEELESLIETGRFRSDLYYRLHVMQIKLPSLQERREDTHLLAKHFLEKWAATLSKPVRDLDEEVLRAFQILPWPGNVRQLENIITSAIAKMRPENTLRLEHFDESFLDNILAAVSSDLAVDNERAAPNQFQLNDIQPLQEAVGALERWLISMTLRETDGNQAQAAEILGITRGTLRKKISQHRIVITAKID